ncbi:MAG: hypothetical protein K2V38_19260, partial [Gemmataceae bacterium]|nr:hypothetical protein [Gemmataceae bacterium]
MRNVLALLLALFTGTLAARSQEAGKQPAKDEGWVDLMKPDVWKKVDDRWVVTDEVKLAPDPKNAARTDVRLKAEKKDGGTIWVNGETGRLPNLITKDAFGDCEIHVEFL